MSVLEWRTYHVLLSEDDWNDGPLLCDKIDPDPHLVVAEVWPKVHRNKLFHLAEDTVDYGPLIICERCLKIIILCRLRDNS